MIKKSQVKICFAKEDDYEQIISLLSEITSTIRKKGGKWKNYSVNSKNGSSFKVFQEVLKSNNKLFIAKIKDEIVGVINMQLVNNIRHGWQRAHLEEIVVKESYRGKGIGTILMDAVKTYCKRHRIKSIKLLCGSQLKEAHKFYEFNGFKFTDRGYRFSID